MYKNYVFDLYGTLVDINTDENNPEVWKKLCLFYGYYGALYSPEELNIAYENCVNGAEDPLYSHEAHPEIQIETVFKKLFTIKGINPKDSLVLHTGQFFRTLTTNYIRLYDGIEEMMENLRIQGKKIYLLSNAQRIFTEYELNMLNITKYFDGIIISSDYGVKKPDPRFYNILFEKYNLNPTESIMIGNDCTTDIAGASAVGMDTFYIHSNISPEYHPEIHATYKLMESDIKKLCKILGITGK